MSKKTYSNIIENILLTFTFGLRICMKQLSYLPGLILTLVIAGVATFLARTQLALQWHFGALTIAILIGIICGNTFYQHISHYTQSGVAFSKGFLLRTGIVLYGFRITLQDIGQVGASAVLSDAVLLVATFFVTCWIGIKLLKIDKQIVQMTAAGCSICGAAAIMATEPVVKAQPYKVSVAVALIVIFGTISMFLYPLMYPFLIDYLGTEQFGIYIGSTIHEVAQVYAAGSTINPAVADTAVISKMIRVMMLAPFLFTLSYYVNKNESQGKITMPFFALYFILVAVVNSFNLIQPELVDWLIELDTILLMMSMSALGLTTNILSIKQAGTKPLLLGALVSVWLILGGFLINLFFHSIFN